MPNSKSELSVKAGKSVIRFTRDGTRSCSSISYSVEATEEEHKLFTMVGTDIFLYSIPSHDIREFVDSPKIHEPIDPRKVGKTFRQVFDELYADGFGTNSTFTGKTPEEAVKNSPYQNSDIHQPVLISNNKERDYARIEGRWLSFVKTTHELPRKAMISCSLGDKCPICVNRGYLESLGELKPRVTGDKDTDYHLAMNFDYEHYPFWIMNWLVLKNEFEVKYSPSCKSCGRKIFSLYIFGCNSWVNDVQSGLCRKCNPANREVIYMAPASSVRSKFGLIHHKEISKDQKSLDSFI